MIHKIKLRRTRKFESVVCPYSVSGICHRNGCIFKPEMDCMKEHEFKMRLAYAKKMSKGKRKYEC